MDLPLSPDLVLCGRVGADHARVSLHEIRDFFDGGNSAHVRARAREFCSRYPDRETETDAGYSFS
jgi:hypothetical protein